jgi:hypothetical protein
MSDPKPARRAGLQKPLFRTFVLLPAAVTAVALMVTVLRGGEASAGDGVELRAATTAEELADASFGPPIVEVSSARDAVETRTGWVVLDDRSEQIVFLDGQGALQARAGGRGPGPGELMRAAHVALLDSFVVVMDLSGTRLDVFSAAGAFVQRVAVGSPDCGALAVRDLLGGIGHVVSMRLCTRTSGQATVLVEEIALSGERTLLEERDFGDLASGTLDPTRTPVIARTGGRLYLGITPDRCVREVASESGPASAICHPDPQPLALPDSLREQFRALSGRLGAQGTSIAVPERYPPFEDILEVSGRLAFHTLLSEDGRAWDVVNDDHLERILLPEDTRVFAGTRGLLLARDQLEGTSFAVLPLPAIGRP